MANERDHGVSRARRGRAGQELGVKDVQLCRVHVRAAALGLEERFLVTLHRRRLFVGELSPLW